MNITNSDKTILIYNIDVIIGIRYRVKSKKGIYFRRWQTKF